MLRPFRLLFPLLAFWAFPAKAELTREALNRQYQGLKGFTAEATQNRSSPYLLKPLRSDVRITYKDEVLTWQVKGQDKLVVRFRSQGLPELEGADAMTGKMPPQAREKLLETLRALRRLMLLDPKLDEDFLVSIKGQELWITPRPNKPGIHFQEIVLTFDQERQLQEMRLKSQDELTQLTFSQLRWMK